MCLTELQPDLVLAAARDLLNGARAREEAVLGAARAD